jgi:hypothetical protein
MVTPVTGSTTTPASEATENREERRYYCQKWPTDVSAILTDAGSMVEWVKCSSCVVPFALPAGDTDSDGDWDATDSTAITRVADGKVSALAATTGPDHWPRSLAPITGPDHWLGRCGGGG